VLALATPTAKPARWNAGGDFPRGNRFSVTAAQMADDPRLLDARPVVHGASRLAPSGLRAEVGGDV